MKEGNFNEWYEFSEMGSGVVAVLDALANFDELVMTSYSDSHEWVVTYWLLNDVTFFLITMKISILTDWLRNSATMQSRSRLLVLNISERIRFYYMHGYNSTHFLIGCCFCNDRAFFSCNHRTLLARCPRHIQSVFNLIVDIPMDRFNGQLTAVKKGTR